MCIAVIQYCVVNFCKVKKNTRIHNIMYVALVLLVPAVPTCIYVYNVCLTCTLLHFLHVCACVPDQLIEQQKLSKSSLSVHLFGQKGNQRLYSKDFFK